MPRRHDHDDVDEELRLHLELREQDLRRQGLDAADARREARRRLGARARDVDAVYDAARRRDRAHRRRDGFQAMRDDLAQAWRRLRREPATTTFMLLILALGLGANLTAFGVADRLLLRGPAHVQNPDALVRVYRRVTLPTIGDQTAPWMPWSTFEVLRAATGSSVTALSVYRKDHMFVGAGAEARRRLVGRASANLFTTLGTSPAAGRFFRDGDERVAVVSDRLASGSLDGRPLTPGDDVVVAGEVYTVIGVAPRGFSGPDLRATDVWLPPPAQTSTINWQIVGRLADDVTPGAASDALAAAHQANLDQSPSWLREATLLATPLGYDDTARPSPESVMARWLLLVSVVVLLITCTNIAGLLVARAVRRERELAIRVALGAGRARLVRGSVFEGLLLAFGAATLSLAISAGIGPTITRALLPEAGVLVSPLDGRVLTALVLISLALGVGLGLTTTLRAGTRPVDHLQRGSRGNSSGRPGLRSALTVAQAALTVVLLIGAGLFLRSLYRVASVDFGFTPDRVITASVEFPPDGESLAEARLIERDRYRRLLGVVRQVPGVDLASVSMGLPFAGAFGQDLHVDGIDAPSLPGGGPFFQVVARDYFETMGTRILQGRGFTDADREGSPPVIVVSRTTAATFWPDTDPLGACVRIGGPAAACTEVVGVAADIHRSGLREEPALQYYLPVGQEGLISGTSLVIRSSGRPGDVMPDLRRAIAESMPAIRAVDLRVLADGLDAELRPLRVGAVLFSLSGAIALLVASLGLYGLMAYVVASRRREIGVRLALGATPGHVRRLIVGRGVALAAAGVATGLLLAVGLRGPVERELFETSALDPLVFVSVGGGLLVVAALATWIPGRRAARTNPALTLTAE